MDLMEAIQLLVLEDFVQKCTNENHSRRLRTIFRFMSCDTVCSKCIREEEATIRVVKHRERNSVWLDEISEFVDCSLIRRQISEDNRMLIHLRENHMEDNICEVDNFCSLACKLDHVLNHIGTLSNIVKQHNVKKKRTCGRKRGHISIFHGFFRLFLLNRKPRSGGRRRRTYVNQMERLLPPKKRHRGAE